VGVGSRAEDTGIDLARLLRPVLTQERVAIAERGRDIVG
jgi:hypothetical protein